ncbi:MAG TPA: MaoC/PaaZ C-terminal domain-containing protein [Solirubrobacteraceae bacterium]|jgi:acyl dehydratase|nr:MaoC/PaaZ C-terminal domain-containing protein [Solirubrobacteraceae bacterium]
MPVNTQAVGKSYASTVYAVGREKVREYALAVGETNPLHLDHAAARAAGYADVVAPPMFAVVYCAPSVAPAIFDPEVGMNFALMVHGGQEFEWGPLVVAGDEVTTTVDGQGHRRARWPGLLCVRVAIGQSGWGDGLRGELDQHRQGGVMASADWQEGDELPELTVTPDRFLTVRYAGASGDFNPIHIDEEFARSVGLPGRILHGLWSMAQVARAQTEAAGGPQALRRLSVQFRGMGVPEQEIIVRGTVRERDGARVVVDTVAEQGGQAIIRNAEAELAL